MHFRIPSDVEVRIRINSWCYSEIEQSYVYLRGKINLELRQNLVNQESRLVTRKAAQLTVGKLPVMGFLPSLGSADLVVRIDP